jgi:hypothetical protein
MVADLVAIPRQSSVRGLTGAPRSPEPLDRAGHIGDAFSVLADVINVLMQVLDNNSEFLPHKMSNNNPYHIVVGTDTHYGCLLVHEGIHDLIGKPAPCDILEENNKTEVKAVHSDLPVKSLDHDGIVLTNLDTTTRAASISDTLEGSIVTTARICVRKWRGHHVKVACKSSPSSLHTYLNGINESSDVVM